MERSDRAVQAATPAAELTITDCPPGTSCPVIEAMRDADSVLLVTEPSLSGKHDLERVADLTRHFDIPAMVCVDKWDLNPQIAEEIASAAAKKGLEIAGRVRYDLAVTAAQVQSLSVVEYQNDACAENIRRVCNVVIREMSGARLSGPPHGSPMMRDRPPRTSS